MSRMSYEDFICPAMAGRVQRYHTWRMIQTQSVGEHSARVAMLYVQFYGMPRAEVLYYCLAHDLGEMHSGDVPYHAKRHSPELKAAMNMSEAKGLDMMRISLPELTEQEWTRFKTCDLLELYEHCRIETMMGNQLAQPCCDTVVGALVRMLGPSEASVVVNAVDKNLPQIEESQTWPQYKTA